MIQRIRRFFDIFFSDEQLEAMFYGAQVEQVRISKLKEMIQNQAHRLKIVRE